MASVLRRRCPDAEVVDVGLERYDAGARRFDLLLAAQAWHWVEPAARREAPPRLLRPGGAVALLWNDYDLGEALHDRVDELYRRLAPELLDDDMAPRRSAGEEPTGDELEAAGLLDVTYRRYDLAGEVEADDFVGVLATTSRYLLLPEDRRSEVLGAIRDLLLETGEPVRFPSGTDVWLARAPR
jgi:hypothetical protein